jgi:hypothetical protein
MYACMSCIILSKTRYAPSLFVDVMRVSCTYVCMHVMYNPFEDSLCAKFARGYDICVPCTYVCMSCITLSKTGLRLFSNTPSKGHSRLVTGLGFRVEG